MSIESKVKKYMNRPSEEDIPTLELYSEPSEPLRVDWLERIQELNSARNKGSLADLPELELIDKESQVVPKAHASGPILEVKWDDEAPYEEKDGFYAGINEDYSTEEPYSEPDDEDPTLEKKIEKPQFFTVNSEGDEAPYKKPNFFKKMYSKFKSHKSPSKLEETVEKSSTNHYAAAPWWVKYAPKNREGTRSYYEHVLPAVTVIAGSIATMVAYYGPIEALLATVATTVVIGWGTKYVGRGIDKKVEKHLK